VATNPQDCTESKDTNSGPIARQTDSPRAEAIREARGDSGSEGTGERASVRGYIQQGGGGEARLPLDRGAG